MAERFANVETMVEFVKKYTPCINGETTIECVERSIRHAPTVEAKPVVHARWVKTGIHYDDVECSHCHDTSPDDYENSLEFDKYCPNCGAQMDENE